MVFYIIKNGVILVGDDRNYIVIVFSKVYSSLCFFPWGCCDLSLDGRCGICCNVSLVITVLLILVGIICSLFYFLDL
jgi:hypothetical protein